MDEKTPYPHMQSRKKNDPREAEAVVSMMNKAIDVSRLQFKRIRNDLILCREVAGNGASVRVFDGRVGEENVSMSREASTALFADIHFLLISLHETEQLLSRLKKLLPHEAELANLHNRYRSMMKRCAEFRMHMEHVDGKDTGDLGKVVDNLFTLRGRGIDLGPSFERNAEALFCDLMSVWTRISERQRKIRELIARRHPVS